MWRVPNGTTEDVVETTDISLFFGLPEWANLQLNVVGGASRYLETAFRAAIVDMCALRAAWAPLSFGDDGRGGESDSNESAWHQERINFAEGEKSWHFLLLPTFLTSMVSCS